MKAKTKKVRKAQVMVEFVMVLGLALCLIGFMFSGFQVMHTKMIFNLAAYEGARNASLKGSNVATSKNLATTLVNDNVMKPISNLKVSINNNISGGYSRCTVSGKVKFMFPILDPSLSTSGIKDKDLITQFTIKKER